MKAGRIVALTTDDLFRRADLCPFVERTVSIDDVKRWKPRPEVYRHAAAAMGLEPPQVALVAAHAWGVQGAGRAGLVTGWVDRHDTVFHPATGSPTVTGRSLTEVADRLVALGE